MKNKDKSDTICALATVQGTSALAVIRVSGSDSIKIVDSVFKPYRGADLSNTSGYNLKFGGIYKDELLLDEVLVSVFRHPHSFTGENSVEISCHGSNYIQQEILMLLHSKGAKMAKPGEFSQRAFLNGKMDLAQAEAVADLISSETAAAHRIAIQQMKGGFSKELSAMRRSLLDLVSLMELELDFSEEDVEFADRTKLNKLLSEILSHISELIDSFRLGNVIKNGVPVAIVGATNTGKSTLLNAILGEERAIVSEIHGTTRDFIEDVVNMGGVAFRFVDTAGIRQTKETIEILGIERTFEKIRSASIVVLMLDAGRPEGFEDGIKQLKANIDEENQKVIVLLNKTDIAANAGNKHNSRLIADMVNSIETISAQFGVKILSVIPVSAKNQTGLDKLKDLLTGTQKNLSIGSNTTLVTNLRHYQALQDARTSLLRVVDGISSELPTDLLTQDIREALYHIGEIVGEINSEEILGNIFGKFCIGK
ncbi:MAG: tRNA uridine-5-carboxymethylaminomethyl(34) synthesis GTPase MnmE [Bacteroidales bacterium]|jgi:tRNA modification GTPase